MTSNNITFKWLNTFYQWIRAMFESAMRNLLVKHILKLIPFNQSKRK